MRTLEAQFTETYSGAGATRTESGTLLLKKPGRMRWDYQRAASQDVSHRRQHGVVLRAGREPGAAHAPVKQLDDLRSPLRYLLGKTKLEKEFEELHHRQR